MQGSCKLQQTAALTCARFVAALRLCPYVDIVTPFGRHDLQVAGVYRELEAVGDRGVVIVVCREHEDLPVAVHNGAPAFSVRGILDFVGGNPAIWAALGCHSGNVLDFAKIKLKYLI